MTASPRWMPIRHVLSIGVLPGVVAILVPSWIARADHVGLHLATGNALLVQGLGAVLLLGGAALFAVTLVLFVVEGRGTLAPWDPPPHLVVRGPYRHVRNPMISGVVFVLFGEAALLLSPSHLAWALVFLALNLVYIPLLEERGLRRRFGAGYDAYRRNVPPIIPRLTPWRGAPSPPHQ